MADLSDVTAYLANTAANAVYPNGFGNPSIAPAAIGFTQPMDVIIREGWPLSEQLDLDLGGKIKQTNSTGGTILATRPNGPAARVSIFPMGGSTQTPYQIQNETYTITPAAINLSVSIPVAGEITITGTPATGEFVTIVADRTNIFSASGATAAAILSALFSQMLAVYPGSTLIGNTLTLPFDFHIDVRQGGVGLVGRVTHRQCQRVMVTVWAPDHNSRAVLAAAIDVAIKDNIIVTLPDTSDMKVIYDTTRVTDELQNVTAYRRDLVYDCEYATLQTFPATTITSVSTRITAGEYGSSTNFPNVEAIT